MDSQLVLARARGHDPNYVYVPYIVTRPILAVTFITVKPARSASVTFLALIHSFFSFVVADLAVAFDDFTASFDDCTLAFIAKTFDDFPVPFDDCPMTFIAARVAIDDCNACIALARASAAFIAFMPMARTKEQ